MWDTIGFIASSKYRESIFLELNLDRRTPKELSDLTNISQPNVTRALKELEDMGLVECLSPDLKKGRLYGPTELGKQVYEMTEKEPKFRSLLGMKLEKKIEEALNKNGIEYDKNHTLTTPLIKVQVDIFITRKNIAVITRFLKDRAADVYKLGFECGEIKKNYKDISIVLYLDGNIEVADRLIKLKEQGYVNEVFFEGEEERLLEFIKNEPP